MMSFRVGQPPNSIRLHVDDLFWWVKLQKESRRGRKKERKISDE
jgi:hypothetical protein